MEFRIHAIWNSTITTETKLTVIIVVPNKTQLSLSRSSSSNYLSRIPDLKNENGNLQNKISIGDSLKAMLSLVPRPLPHFQCV